MTSLPFDRMDSEQGMVAESWHDKFVMALPIIKYGTAVIGMLLLFLFVVRPVIRNTFAVNREAMEDMTPQISEIPGVSVELSGKMPQPQIALSPLDDKSLSEADMAKQMAGADAKKFAELLRNWLK